LQDKMSCSGQCSTCPTPCSRGIEISDLSRTSASYSSDMDFSDIGYGSSDKQYGSPGISSSYSLMRQASSPGSKSPPYNSQNSSSIDDLLPYQKMRPAPQINNGFYQKPEARFYAPGQSGDFGEADYTRVQKGYGVNSQIEGQYGIKR